MAEFDTSDLPLPKGWQENTKRAMVCLTAMAHDAHWYNEHRPHQSLDGATPLEMYERTTAANQKPRYEPRRQWPPDAPCAAPYAQPKPDQGALLTLVIRFAGRYKKLPIIELHQAA